MMPNATTAQRQFSVLAVCTGNVCRSPLVEQLLRTGLDQRPEVVVSSAGTGALVGHPMTDQAQALALEFGGRDPHTHRARALTLQQLDNADLVIALSREHRAAIVGMLPRASRRVFTLRELARLLTDLPAVDLEAVNAREPSDIVGRLTQLVEVAASRRGFVEPPALPDDDDVVDPYRQSDEVYRHSAEQLVPAVEAILAQFSRGPLTTGLAR